VIDFGDRGIYSENNRLNDLTGKEWKFWTRSVISKQYPLNLQFKIRRQHGGQKPPQLCADLIQIFTKKGELVFDPLMGVGGTLLGASLCGRAAIGFELNPKWIEVYKQVCALEKIKEQKTAVGDSKLLLQDMQPNSIDFILTDVPYWNIDKLEQTRSKRASKTHLKPFNGSVMQSKERWSEEMKMIFVGCHRVLKPHRYMAVFIGDIYRAGRYHMLSAELAQKIGEIQGFTLKANLVWYDVSKSLHVYGYPFSFVPSMIHQNILIFQKEDG
jgi:DNA modification methylase